jgi:flagellar biosynthesis/type III secretory pathway chaperone
VNEIQQRVAILKRLREMLQRQRGKFQSYLALLEKEQEAIERGDAERLLAQVEMEQSIISEIFTLKKAIAPLEDLYQAAYPERETTIPGLKTTLEKMGEQIIAHNAINRALLREKMEDLRHEVALLRAWPKRASPFAEAVPSLVDITT